MGREQSSFLGVRISGYVAVAINVCFSVIAILGQVGQNVSLPLWTGATGALRQPNCSGGGKSEEDVYISDDSESNSSNSSSYQPEMDPFFVLSFASLSFMVIFGVITAVILVTQFCVNTFTGKKLNWISVQNDLKFPQWQLFLIGFFDALNGLFVVYASSPARTAPFLQAILGNFIIPLTIFFRLVLLRKNPTLVKLIAAAVVLLGLLISLIPVISGMDQDSKEGNRLYLQQTRASQILWPLCFMFGFIPAAVMNVIEEKSLKDTRKVNMFYLLFVTSTYQLITVWCLFWTDLIPNFGFVDKSITEFGENYKFAFQCFFGGAGCTYQPGISGSMFILMYFISYLGGGLLIRYAEGATYLAVVQALVTPFGALFWSIFSLDECSHFHAHPHAGSLTYFSIGGLVVMVPAIFLYNIGTWQGITDLFSGKSLSRGRSKSLPPTYNSSLNQQEESDPLLFKKGSHVSYNSSTN